MLEIIDVSNWVLASEDFITGTREKKLIKEHEKSEVEYLLKFPKGQGEAYAEVVTYLLATNFFNVNVPETHFARENDCLGVLSKSFIDEKNNTEAIAAMDFFGHDFDPEDLYQYTIYKAYEIVDDFNLLADFYRMCIFDYIVANQDRHSENWELLKNDEISTPYIFAPIFDNGTALFGVYSYKDPKIKNMLTDEVQFKAYTNWATSSFSIEVDGKIKKRPKAILVLNYLYRQNNELFIEIFSHFNKISYDDVYGCIEFISNEILGEPRKKLIGKLIIYRIEQIEKLIEKGGD